MRGSIIGSATAALAACAALFAHSAAAIDPIVIKGQHFFYQTNGSEFFIRGVAYQQDVNSNGTVIAGSSGAFDDPLADSAGCARDIPYLQALKTNVIRVYAINSSLDHSACMNMLQAAGIYVIQDLSNPLVAINRDAPTWTTDLYASYAAVIDALAPYNNTLGFFAGNEVSNQVSNTNASAFVKAAVRDMKSYIKQKNYRALGVGYATNDDAAIRGPLADYFNCGDAASAIDFWGYNIYSWCGASSYTMSGYDQRTAEFANYSVPVFFAEYGCNTDPPRLFTEVQALYGTNMTPVWSGGIVYMYFQETNNYGLVSVSGNTVSTISDFNAYSTQIAIAAPSSTPASAYTVTNTAARACPTVDASWAASSNLPPIANAEVCSCMLSSLSCVAATTLTSNATATLFSYVCANDAKACNGITTNSTSGVYGSYSMCQPYQQLSYAMNQYYTDNGKSAQACSFNGQAKVQTASVNAACSALLNQAGTSGTGVVTSVPSATGSGASAASSTKSAAANVVVPHFDMSLISVGFCTVLAALTGAGMLLL